MTELQWLIKILTTEKLQPKIKDMFIERMGEVEALLSKPMTRAFTPPVQALSTQRILTEIDAEQAMGINPPPIPVTLASQIPPRIIGQEVITSKGNGTSTRGPRKF